MTTSDTRHTVTAALGSLIFTALLVAGAAAPAHIAATGSGSHGGSAIAASATA